VATVYSDCERPSRFYHLDWACTTGSYLQSNLLAGGWCRWKKRNYHVFHTNL